MRGLIYYINFTVSYAARASGLAGRNLLRFEKIVAMIHNCAHVPLCGSEGAIMQRLPVSGEFERP